MPQLEPPESYRLFVALTVPEQVKVRMAEAQRQLHGALSGGSVRWTSPEQMHLTLRFLGNVVVVRTDALVEALRAACRAFGVVRLQAAGIGFFPKPRSPRVVWAGVTDEQDRLETLWTTVQSATSSFTCEEPETRFTGHITLARIKSIRPGEGEALATAADVMAHTVFGQWTAGQVEVIRSRLSSQGAKYDTLAGVQL